MIGRERESTDRKSMYQREKEREKSQCTRERGRERVNRKLCTREKERVLYHREREIDRERERGGYSVWFTLYFASI